ncbi:MAG TPA: hypothetical protein VFA90_07780 [Terriglobales bacterium]|nr:hypothetical protein [Terriglobales bacterium]
MRRSLSRVVEQEHVARQAQKYCTRRFREICSAFVRARPKPTVLQMMQIYRILRSELKATLKSAGAKDPFNARVFSDLCLIASAAADEIVLRRP